MNKELTPLEAFKNIFNYLAEDSKRDYKVDLKIIKTTLKEKGKQDLILNFLKEHIVFEEGVVKADFQWEVDDEETEEAIKEWLK